MLKSTKQTSLFIFFATFFSCSGAELPEISMPTSTPASIVKKQPSTRGHIRFQTESSAYQDLRPETSTVAQRQRHRHAALTKQQALVNQVQMQSTRSRPQEKANFYWNTDGTYNPAPYGPALETAVLAEDAQERLEKLQALTNVLEIEREIVALNYQELLEKHHEQLERRRLRKEEIKAANFMKMTTMTIPELYLNVPIFCKLYPQEMIFLVDFMVDALIEDETIEDKTLAQKDFATKKSELITQGAFHPQPFQYFLKEYLKVHDYSFPQPAPTFLPLAQPATGMLTRNSLMSPPTTPIQTGNGFEEDTTLQQSTHQAFPDLLEFPAASAAPVSQNANHAHGRADDQPETDEELTEYRF